MSARQKDIIQDHLRDGLVFENVVVTINDEMERLVADYMRRLEGCSSMLLHAIKFNIHIATSKELAPANQRSQKIADSRDRVAKQISALKQKHAKVQQQVAQSHIPK